MSLLKLIERCNYSVKRLLLLGFGLLANYPMELAY